MKINFWSLLFLLLIASCGDQNDVKPRKELVMDKEMKEEVLDANKEWFIEEQAKIDNFVKRRQWDVSTTGTGIRYAIYQKADTINNPRAIPGQVAVVNFEVRLLDKDSVCYSSGDDTEWFLIEMDNVESGLHEAIQYLRKGDRAKIILPSYLAHGLMGDMDKIPPQSPVLYDIELVELTTKEEIRNRYK